MSHAVASQRNLLEDERRDMENQMSSVERRNQSLEDENKRLKDENERLRDELRFLRTEVCARAYAWLSAASTLLPTSIPSSARGKHAREAMQS